MLADHSADPQSEDTDMATPDTQNRPPRLWRWGLLIAVMAVVLGAWWLAVDRFATRIGLDARDTMRELPRNEDTRRPID
ncbi:hypothetical protein EGK76_12585 [Luteimonas sp. 100069]|nr:hypothetical protein EGK76_12585 [Luteimonas sp. 100069]